MTTLNNSLRSRSLIFNGGNSPSMLRWRAAVGRVLAGTGRGRILLVADSLGMGGGAGSGGATNENGAWAKAWPRTLALQLAARGIPTSDQGMFGSQNSQVAYATYDPRVNQGAWGISGPEFFFSSAAATLAFTPTTPIDTVLAFFIESGVLRINFDGGATAYTSLGGGSLQYVSSTAITTTLGSHTINALWFSGNAFLGGLLAYNSAIPAIDIMQRGWHGATVSSFDPTQTQPYDGPNEIKAYVPDLTIFCLTANDSINSGLPGIAAYTTGMQALISAALVSGDVLLMVAPPIRTDVASDAVQIAYENALYGLAVSNDVGFMSMRQRLGGEYTIANAAQPYYDSVHLLAPGYADWGRAVVDILTS